jgi:ABC-type uncharacterized transport system YnjBCD ATPase subunit
VRFVQRFINPKVPGLLLRGGIIFQDVRCFAGSSVAQSLPFALPSWADELPSISEAVAG